MVYVIVTIVLVALIGSRRAASPGGRAHRFSFGGCLILLYSHAASAATAGLSHDDMEFILLYSAVLLLPGSALAGALRGCRNGSLTRSVAGGFLGVLLYALVFFSLLLMLSRTGPTETPPGKPIIGLFGGIVMTGPFFLGIPSIVVGIPTGLAVWAFRTNFGTRSVTVARAPARPPRSTPWRPIPKPELQKRSIVHWPPPPLSPKEKRQQAAARIQTTILCVIVLGLIAVVIGSAIFRPFQAIDYRKLVLLILFINTFHLLMRRRLRRGLSRLYAEVAGGAKLAAQCGIKLGHARIEFGVAQIRDDALTLTTISKKQIQIPLSDIAEVERTKWQRIRGARMQFAYYPLHTVFRFRTPEIERLELVIVDADLWRPYLDPGFQA